MENGTSIWPHNDLRSKEKRLKFPSLILSHWKEYSSFAYHTNHSVVFLCPEIRKYLHEGYIHTSIALNFFESLATMESPLESNTSQGIRK